MSISSSEFRDALKRKYDILEMDATTKAAEQLAKAPYYAAAAKEHEARANLIPAANAENWAKAKLYEAQAEGMPAHTQNMLAEAAGRRSATDIARQKWTQFEMPAERIGLETLRELTPLQKEQKKSQMEMMTKLFQSPEFQKQYFGLDANKPTAKPMLAKPSAAMASPQSFMDIDRAITEEQNKWQPTGSAPVDWLARRGRNLLLAAPRMMGAAASGISKWDMWND